MILLQVDMNNDWICSFNDNPKTKHADVISGYNKTIERLAGELQ